MAIWVLMAASLERCIPNRDSHPWGIQSASSNLQVECLSSASEGRFTLFHFHFHFRDLDGLEVDIIIELADGRQSAAPRAVQTPVWSARVTTFVPGSDRTRASKAVAPDAGSSD